MNYMLRQRYNLRNQLLHNTQSLQSGNKRAICFVSFVPQHLIKLNTPNRNMLERTPQITVDLLASLPPAPKS